MPLLTLLLCLLLGCATTLAAPAPPQRIASMNLCTDHLLLLLVERERIVTLSRFAADPQWSWLAEEARGIPGNRGQAEEILAFAPDLILTSQFSATLAGNLLEQLGHSVARLGFANSPDEAYAQIRQVAALAGREAAGAALIADITNRIARANAVLRPHLQGKRALFLTSNGFSYGSGTLQHAFLEDLGLRNVAAEAGLVGPAPMPLELLLVASPDFIFHDTPSALGAQLAQPLLQHPALDALGQRTRRLILPEAWFQCAGPRMALPWESLQEQLL